MDYFKILPEEITLDILTRLPAETVLDSKLVCTNWRSLVSYHPLFSKLHLYHLNNTSTALSGKLSFLAFEDVYYQITTRPGYEKFHYFEYKDDDESIQRIKRVNLVYPFDVMTFVSSCNGLICLALGRCVCVYNPITREYVMLPEIDNGTVSFGYVPSTNEYKVVVVYGKYKSRSQLDEVEVLIYTLGSGTGWRNLGKFNSESKPDDWNYAGILANGALYWLDSRIGRIITFDLVKEKFCEHLSPPFWPADGDWFYGIVVLGGFLSFAIGPDIEGSVFKDIWILKKNDNHGQKEGVEPQSLCWSKEFTVGDSHLFAVMRNGRVLTYDDYHISIYDTKNSTTKRLLKFKNPLFRVYPHKNTLISLKELGEKVTKRMELVKIEDTNSHDVHFERLQEDANPEYTYL